MSEGSTSDATAVEPGERVFDDDGEPLGLVVAMTDAGFEVETVGPDEPEGSDQEEVPGQGAGEGYLMWRCDECGEMGELEDGMPSTCPNCGAPGSEVSEAKED